MIDDEFWQLRVKVLRRVVYGLNTLALEGGRVPAEGPFDVAVANGVAAILSAEQPGTEVDSTGKVHPPGQLLFDSFYVVDQDGPKAWQDGTKRT
jgi:hypothetical protein